MVEPLHLRVADLSTKDQRVRAVPSELVDVVEALEHLEQRGEEGMHLLVAHEGLERHGGVEPHLRVEERHHGVDVPVLHSGTKGVRRESGHGATVRTSQPRTRMGRRAGAVDAGMTQTDTTPSSTSPARLGIGSRLALAVLLLGVMLAGILVLGRLASSDVMAMALTSVFFVLLAAGLFVLVRRRRELLLPLGAVYVLVAGVAGVVLGLPLITDDVVNEDVVVVNQPAAPAAGATSQSDDASGGSQSREGGPSSEAGSGETTGARQVASGEFEARDHPGVGTATLVDTGDGTVLTLTEFATDNGPDLFVYLVPADAPDGSVEGSIDLGTLKGNVGDQQYDVPDEVDAGAGWRVVVWCRAFAVTFTEALLA